MFDLRFLNNLKQKLTTGNRGSIYLNALPERYLSRLPVEDLNKIQANLADNFLKILTSQADFSFSLIPDGLAQSEDAKKQLDTVLRRLSIITIENNDYFAEQGVKTFGFGFPVLVYRDKKDPNKVVKAPMFIWSLDIERNFKRANEWVISRKEDFAVINNTILAVYLRTDAEIQLESISEDFLSDGLVDKSELATLVYQQLKQLHPNLSTSLLQDFEAALEQPVQALKSKESLEVLPLEQAQILWSGVFGLFKSQKESIISDLDYFINNSATLEQQLNQSIQQRKAAASQLMQHSFTAVNTDPSQQHLLHLLQKGNNLVIQGPPGTGKSQTLTGIISNILANEGTCLVVCEKKTALEVVYQNLVDAGLGELAVIVEDVYRDRSEVVNSVRERAQKEASTYETSPTYLRLLASCVEQLERLQGFHYTQLKALIDDRTWAELVNVVLTTKEKNSSKELEQYLKLNSFEFHPTELQTILPIFPKSKELLAPLGTLTHPHNALHPQFYSTNNSKSEAKLEIHRSLTTALRFVNQTQELITTTVQGYNQQLENHYTQLYHQKLNLTDSLFAQTQTLIQQTHKKLSHACTDAQQAIIQTTKEYNEGLESHFDTLYNSKITGIDKTASLVKSELYGSIDGVLDTLREAKEDIMACLYVYEELLEKHFESVYMQKLDLVDAMLLIVETNLASSPYYFNKNKGAFRALLRGVSTTYKSLEKDKEEVLKKFVTLEKLHQEHGYFKFDFMSVKDPTLFTFADFLKHLKSYQEAAGDWHRALGEIIQDEVKQLNSKHSHKAVPYKLEAQAINQHLSDFRSKILKNQLFPIEFKYDSLRLRERFDQLELIEQQVQKIKEEVNSFVYKNEQNWDANSFELQIGSPDTFHTAFEDLQKTHKEFAYFNYDFIKLGRPKLLADYYFILSHLKDYRAKVEQWYPSRLPIIKEYQQNFKEKNLYPALNFKEKAEQLTKTLRDFTDVYNHEQLFKIPYQLEKILFSEQLEELKHLESLLDNWATNFDNFLIETNKNWTQHLSDSNHIPVQINNESFVASLEELTKTHLQHDYFDYNFEHYNHPKELYNQAFIQNLVAYRTWTEQWYQQRQAIFENLVKNLSKTKVLAHVPLAKDVEKIANNIQQFQDDFNEFQHLKNNFEFGSLLFLEQKKQLDLLELELLELQGAFENFDVYYDFRAYWETLSTAQQAAYQGLSNIPTEDWTNAFTIWYLDALLQHYQPLLPDKNSYETAKKLFLQHTTEFKKILISHSLQYWRARQSQSIEQFHREKSPIKVHSLYNKRGGAGDRRTSLRKIIATSPSLFQSFFPVLLVSPSVCSAILPLQADLFDVVVFDEASQLRLEDTFCALVRGKYKVVSGDSQQMPPSDYFQSSSILLHEEEVFEDADKMEEVALINESIDFLTQAESLLDFALAEGSYKESFLEIHYRSQHPYLIDFSNAAFYGNRLTPMPSKTDYVPMEFVEVNGSYVNYTNPSEAEQIIDYILSVAATTDEDSCPSIGIATFNMHQRNLILESIQQRALKNSKTSSLLQQLFMKGLFVKNLENIQGDERDMMLISTTFGIKPDGSFIQNFGPINQQRGYRLLNVIITRAKQKVCVFTSIPASYYESYRTEITEKGNMGKGVFYAYLAYVKAVSQQQETSRQAILQLLYQHCQRKPVDNNLYRVNDNAFKQRVVDFLEAALPNRVVVNYRYAGFEIPLMVKDLNGQPKWAFYYDTYHQKESEEAYLWDLFRTHHLRLFGFDCHRIWSKDWWLDVEGAKRGLLELLG